MGALVMTFLQMDINWDVGRIMLCVQLKNTTRRVPEIFLPVPAAFT